MASIWVGHGPPGPPGQSGLVKAYVYGDFSCQNNGKNFYLADCHPNHNGNDRTRDSAEVLLMWILYHGGGNITAQ